MIRSKNPIIYFCYNRYNYTKKTIKILKNVKCPLIYIVCDGPKNSVDEKKVNKVKNLIKQIKFSSKVKKIFRKKNLGCKISVSKGLDLFFKKEKAGIILEDDIIYDQGFIDFCDYGLSKYKDKKNISMVSGTNYLSSHKQSNEYFYSTHFIIWGWATWREKWKKYDVEMKNWNNPKIKEKLKKKNSKEVFNFLKYRFNQLTNNYKDTWDIQWYFTCLENEWLSLIPKTNLVSNIGLKGTHSSSYYDTLYLKIGKINISKIAQPKIISSNHSYDYKLHKYYNFKKNFIQKVIFKLYFIFLKYLKKI